MAILILMEEGALTLNTPVSEFIPTFAKTTVMTKGESGVAPVPARRAINIKDLLTHTAGISYGTDASVSALYEAKGLGPAAGYGWYTADKDEPVCDTMERLGTLPFVAQPGEAYVYGYNTDILGCVVERASKMPLDQFIATRITTPLGMKDTRFFLPPDQRARLATVYSSGPDGKIVRAPEGATRPGALRRRPAEELLRRGGSAVDRARLRPLPRDDPQRRRARRRADPLAPHRRADDDESERDAALAHRVWVSASASRRSIATAPTDELGRHVRVGRRLRLPAIASIRTPAWPSCS